MKNLPQSSISRQCYSQPPKDTCQQPTIYLVKSHLFHTCEVCTIWPEAGIVKGLFWNTSFLKPHPPPLTFFPFLSKVHNSDEAKGFILKHQTKNWRMIHLAASILLLTTSSRTGESISPAYVQTLQYPQRTWLQCADPTVIKQWMLTSAHLSCDSPLQFIFIYCLMTKASFHLLIGILLPIFN